MDTKYLTYILTIAKKGNMTKAAEELYVSQSTLSQYLSRLESELGTPLFYRSKGRLTLTAAGKLYIDAARQVMSIKDDLYTNIQHLENRGHITIGVTSQFALEMLTAIIPPFKATYPDVTLEISETNVPSLTQLLMEEIIDCGIMALNTIEPFAPEQIHILRQEEVFFAVPRSHLYCQINTGQPIAIEDFSHYFSKDNILMAKKDSTLRLLADRIIEMAGWIPSTMCETNSILATRSMVAMGIGAAFIAESCAIDKEHVAYYSLVPKQYRLNAFVTRKNWVMNNPENSLSNAVLQYFEQKKA